MTTTGRRLAGAVLALAGLAAGSGASAADPWQALHRPFHLPAQPPRRCLATPATPVGAGIAISGQGAGPVYPVGAYPTLAIIPGGRKGQPWFPSAWGGGEMQFAASPSFAGPVLIRGRRLGGAGEVAVGADQRPAIELHVVIPRRGRGSWWTAAVYTRVQAVGCYAWQIDGRNFSRVVVFRAVPSRDL
jgi:hypothetical protein